MSVSMIAGPRFLSHCTIKNSEDRISVERALRWCASKLDFAFFFLKSGSTACWKLLRRRRIDALSSHGGGVHLPRMCVFGSYSSLSSSSPAKCTLINRSRWNRSSVFSMFDLVLVYRGTSC